MTNQTQKNNLNYLIDPTFTKVNRRSFENEDDKISFSNYYVPNVQIKDGNVLINGKSLFDMPIKNEEETYEIIEMGRNIITQQVIYWIMNTFQSITNQL